MIKSSMFYTKDRTFTKIVDSIKDIYNVYIFSSLVSKVANNVIDDITSWRNQSLSNNYHILYLDCIVSKVYQYKPIINKAIYSALEVRINNKKEPLAQYL